MKVAIIGAGNMGGAIARGLAQGTIIPASDVTVADPFSGSLETLQADYPEINNGKSESDKGCRYRYSGSEAMADRSGIECDSSDSPAGIGFYRRGRNLRTAGEECRPGTDHIPSDTQHRYFSVGKYDLDIQS